MNTALSCEGVSIRYGAVEALKDVTVSFEAGKIHTLLGQNGAGKTTLARFCSGVASGDQGKLAIRGRRVTPGNVTQVRALGLEIVHQRLTLPPGFTVADALELSATRKKGRAIFSSRAVARSWGDDMRRAGIDASPSARIGALPIETVQSLEILRAMSGDARILILDEPTALLSPGAISALFARLRRLRDEGVTLIVILHKLQEVLEIADTVSVLREGRLVAETVPVSQTTSASLSDLMIGSGNAGPAETGERRAIPSGGPRLEINAVTTVSRKAAEPELRDVSLRVRASEILGVAGIEGNGQRQLADVICGFAELQDGRISLDGRDLSKLSAAARRRVGVRAVPFDRMTEGASLDTPLWENVTAWCAEAFRDGRLPFLSIRAMRRKAECVLNALGVKFSSVDQPAVSLSGGNLQRLILSRELAEGAGLLVAAQPTRGLDFSATEFVLDCLRRLRDEGSSVIVMSSDLDELFEVSDRLIVLRAGRVAGEFDAPFDRQSVGDAMVGAAR